MSRTSAQRIAIATVFGAVLLASPGCAPPTSTCGAGATAGECREWRAAFSRTLDRACDGSDPSAQFRQENAGSPETIATMHFLCGLASSLGREATAYHVLAASKCAIYEETLPEEIRTISSVPAIAAPHSKQVYIEHDESMLAMCRDFRAGEMSGRDFLYEEARLVRALDPVDIFLEEMKRLTSSLAGLALAILGAIATLVGIVAGLRSIVSRR